MFLRRILTASPVSHKMLSMAAPVVAGAAFVPVLGLTACQEGYASTTTTTVTSKQGLSEIDTVVDTSAASVQDKVLMDLRLDLLDRGAAVAGASSAQAQKAIGKVVADGPHKGKPYVYRIVLTGGPCGGKSSSLKTFSKKLTAMGFDVYCVPEVPTIMMNGGCRFPGVADKPKLLEFESALLRMQIQTERTFLQVAASTGKPSVVVMDRGINDIKAYVTPEIWTQMLDSHGLTEEYIDARYDLVLHLVTAADGAEKFYTTANNAARSETPEQARQLDKMVAKGYEVQQKTGKFAYIDNSTNFAQKMTRATQAVMDMLDRA